MCVCLCVRERERERVRESVSVVIQYGVDLGDRWTERSGFTCLHLAMAQRMCFTHPSTTRTVFLPAAIFVSKGINSNTCSVYCPGALVLFLINTLLTGTTIPRVGSGGEKIDNLAQLTVKLVSLI